MFRSIVYTLPFLLCPVLLGCSSVYQNHKVLYPLPSDGITVEGDKIYHDGKLFAELRYFFWSGDSKEFKDIGEYPVKGLAIYYHTHSKEVWISPKEGWSAIEGEKEFHNTEDVQRIWNHYRTEVRDLRKYSLRLGGRPPGKERIITTGAKEIRISPDGKIVQYKKPDLFIDDSLKYYVELGISD